MEFPNYQFCVNELGDQLGGLIWALVDELFKGFLEDKTWLMTSHTCDGHSLKLIKYLNNMIYFICGET